MDSVEAAWRAFRQFVGVRATWGPAVLRDADPTAKAEVYRQLGLRLTYQPENANGAR
ncbi:hypothetical protein ABZ403_20325 [Micromonospora zamorensis]|uniref:hypothetical protein n=1 Tax=Micromonospora zamorensis TaxID=709883 RepID=UPI0033C440BE